MYLDLGMGNVPVTAYDKVHLHLFHPKHTGKDEITKKLKLQMLQLYNVWNFSIIQ